MLKSPIVFAGLMPHAPILVPGVGGARLAEAGATARAMTAVAAHAIAAHPDTVVLISPHSPRRPGAFGIWHTPRLRGSLADFGSPADRVDLPLDRPFADQLEKEAAHRKLRTWEITQATLDHGALVPLRYLIAAGWQGPAVILSLNYPGEGGLDGLGEAIAAAAQSLQRRTAIIASGDMSHRLTRSAPGGYHPGARRFDETFIALLRKGTPGDLRRIDPALLELAAEDVVDSTIVALAATGDRTDGHAVLSYEGPFGVGYGVAILFEPEGTGNPAATTKESPAQTVSHLNDLPAVARRAVETGFTGGPKTPPFQAAGELTERHGVFVTVRTETGALRGCIGTLTAKQKGLVGETWHNALAATRDDYRFPPVEAAELPRLRFSVTVLGELEPVTSPEKLNPAVYGVVVTAIDGRKGVLLPAIAGISSVEQQLALARRKAGIAPGEWIGIQRFTARSGKEPSFVEEGDREHD
ncbi:MAG: AmmeMemoRadiSam system protein A [Opitutaceae bacterium]|nr:AmmeMemoRadiSam system protein A [Opitutaceae bacterium]